MDERLLFSKAAEQPVEIGAGVAPVERGRDLLVAGLEGQQSAFDLGEVGEVVRVSTVRCTTEK